MNENTRYRTSGNLALAYQEEGEQRFVLVKKGNMREAVPAPATRHSLCVRNAGSRLSRSYSLQDALEESYNSKRSILDGLRTALVAVRRAWAANPLVYQLLHGSAKGNPVSKDTIAPFALTSSVCTAISLIAVLVGS